MVGGGGASRDASRPAAHMRAAEMAKVPRDVACPSTGLVQYLPPSRATLSKRWTDRCETQGYSPGTQRLQQSLPPHPIASEPAEPVQKANAELHASFRGCSGSARLYLGKARACVKAWDSSCNRRPVVVQAWIKDCIHFGVKSLNRFGTKTTSVRIQIQ